MKYIGLFIIGCILITSCQPKEDVQPVLNVSDYNDYLAENNDETISSTISTKNKWAAQISNDSTQLAQLGFVAGAYNNLFSATGNIAYLDSVSMANDKALEISSETFKAGNTRTRAASYISQHRFKEAEAVLDSVKNLSGKDQTALMLYDAYMELGQYDKAKMKLDSLKNQNNFSYLIRAAKWNDYKGDLDTAIKLLEKARDKAESSNNKPLKIWAYSNIGDFYGHAGRIKGSYNSYLKTLELEPSNAYAKKGLAWIAYSNDKNPDEAIRILDSVMAYHKSPDYHLLKAEIFEFKGDSEQKDKELDMYWEAVQNPSYGDMYNAYNIVFLAEEKQDYDAALRLAEREINNRATPETYQLLAYANHLAGNNEKALEIIENHVMGKTYEPDALFHAALIYKANGKLDKVKELKEDELMGTAYEMGPVTYEEIKNL